MRLRCMAVGVAVCCCLGKAAAAEEPAAIPDPASGTFSPAGVSEPEPTLLRPSPVVSFKPEAQELQEVASASDAPTWAPGIAAVPAYGAYSPAGSSFLRGGLAALAVVGAGFLFDDMARPGSGDGTFMEDAGREMGSPITLAGGTALLGAYALATHDGRTAGVARDLGLAMGATSATVLALKTTVGRERPDEADHQSFPSGHTANAFAAATVLDREVGGLARWLGYGTAAFIGASRIVGDRHRLSDVVAGAVIGHLYGRLISSKKSSSR